MRKLHSDYWNTFIYKDKDGKEKGNGIEFENLVNHLLILLYGKEWIWTQKSHDDNRDFWLYFEQRHIWAECKNYKNPIAMSILAPTLVMAQIYEVNEILFFSRSNINSFAKDKIMAFGEKSNKTIIFYDGEKLEELIYRYGSKLPDKYSPFPFLETDKFVLSTESFIHVYFFRNAINNIQRVSEVFMNYTNADTIYYNEVFALNFCLMNPFPENNVEVCIEFVDEGDERFSFEYLYPTIVPEKKQWYQAYLKEGEGRAVSLNMRQIRFQSEISLPQFHILFVSHTNGKQYDWYSQSVSVKCNWIGKTRLIGANYLKIPNKVREQLLHNPYLSGMVISGSSGTGKSRILTECQNVFLKNGYRIINFSVQKDFSSHYFLKEIVCFLYEIPDDTILEVLEERLISDKTKSILYECSEVEKAVSLLKIIIRSNTEDSLQEILNMYGSIIYEKLSKNKNVLVIDNIQYAGKTFLNFIENYIYYGVNQQSLNYSVFLFVFNLDYMTPVSSELLYNILNSNIKHLLSFQLNGFNEKEQGILFLQELTRTNENENLDYFSKIIEKISLNPYYLYQTVKYLEEIDVISISPNKQGYIITNLKKYHALSEITNGITDVLERRFQFMSSQISLERILFICSAMYLFEAIDSFVQSIFQINSEELIYLCKKNIFRSNNTKIYFFDHDIIRNFFYQFYGEHVFDSLKWLLAKGNNKKIKRYRIVYLLYEIAILKKYDTLIELSNCLSDMNISERIASVFYNCLLESFSDMLINQHYEGIYIKYIHQLCAYIRQYDGSEKAWHITKGMYDIIQAYYPAALSEDTLYYRPFIHFCCDIAVESYFYEEERLFIKDVLNACKNANPTKIECRDEIFVLEAIMYNRWYISYNTESFKEEIQNERKRLMERSKEYIEKIVDPQKRRLIEYLNFSDEGYNFYGYQKDKEKLLNIWNYCIIDIPILVPEKTLNYYRKMVQYGLIEQNEVKVREETKKALLYLEHGEYSHEPVIFRTFFLMAEIMCNLQHSPQKTYYYNFRMIDSLLEMQRLLNNHKLGDILLLKGVNAYYAGNEKEVYYAFKEAWKHYETGETSRYWIKKSLLKENIHYSFTVLGIYKTGYDVSCFPAECRQPLILSKKRKFTASGIQRTGDLYLNLPLI